MDRVYSAWIVSTQVSGRRRSGDQAGWHLAAAAPGANAQRRPFNLPTFLCCLQKFARLAGEGSVGCVNMGLWPEPQVAIKLYVTPLSLEQGSDSI